MFRDYIRNPRKVAETSVGKGVLLGIGGILFIIVSMEASTMVFPDEKEVEGTSIFASTLLTLMLIFVYTELIETNYDQVEEMRLQREQERLKHEPELTVSPSPSEEFLTLGVWNKGWGTAFNLTFKISWADAQDSFECQVVSTEKLSGSNIRFLEQGDHQRYTVDVKLPKSLDPDNELVPLTTALEDLDHPTRLILNAEYDTALSETKSAMHYEVSYRPKRDDPNDVLFR